MPNILVAWQADAAGRLPTIAAAVATGARTVRAADVMLCPLQAVDIDGLRWCDGLVLGVHPDPCHGTALEEWGRRLEPCFRDAVQGKFASVFVAVPEEVRKRTRAHESAVRLLTAHGMLVIGFTGSAAATHTHIESSPRHFQHEYERLGRFSAGMVHAWIDRAGSPHRQRILGSLVRATRRVPAVRCSDMTAGSASRGYPLSGVSDDMIPNC